MQKLTGFLTNTARITFAILMVCIAIFATIVSTGLTIYSFNRMIDNVTNQIIVGGFFVLMQIMVLLGGLSLGFISKYCPQHYKFVKIFTNLAFVISVLSTITYFSVLDIAEREKVIEDLLELVPFIFGTFKEWLIVILTNLTLIWLSCVMLDLMAMKFPAVGIDLLLKNNVVTKVKTEKGFFGKIFYIATAGIQSKINTRFATKKFEVETEEKENKEEIEQAKRNIKKEKPIVKDLDIKTTGQEKKEVVVEDPNEISEEKAIDENIVKFPDINKTEDTKEEDEEPIFTLEEQKLYLEFIIANRENNVIPTNREVMTHFENLEGVYFNPRKISKIRESLYKQNILIKPETFNSKTTFTNEFYQTINADIKEDEKNESVGGE